MAALHFPVSETALLLVDPYNDFLSPGGKLYEPAKAVIESTGTVAHMRALLAAVCAAGPRHRSQRAADRGIAGHP